MESRYRDSDRQIYVNSVFWYILLFWKRIIAVTVIMAVVVMGFGSATAYLKEKKAIKDAPVVDYEAMAKDETVIRALSVKKQYDEFEKNYYNDYVNNIDSSNEIIGEYMCQGKMPNSVRERYMKMKESDNCPPNIDALIDNFDKALSHPDKKDLDNLCKRVVKARSNVIE